MNQGTGYGFEIPVKYCFYGKVETVNLVKTFIEKIYYNVQKKCLMLKCVLYFCFWEMWCHCTALWNQNT